MTPDLAQKSTGEIFIDFSTLFLRVNFIGFLERMILVEILYY